MPISDRISGDRAENLELAIASDQAALEVFTLTKSPDRMPPNSPEILATYTLTKEIGNGRSMLTY